MLFDGVPGAISIDDKFYVDLALWDLRHTIPVVGGSGIRRGPGDDRVAYVDASGSTDVNNANVGVAAVNHGVLLGVLRSEWAPQSFP